MNSEINTLIGTWNPESSSKKSTRNSYSKRSTRHSSLNNIEMNNSAIDTVDQDEETSRNTTSKSTKDVSQVIRNSKSSKHSSKVNPSSEIVLNVNSKLSTTTNQTTE